MAAVSFPWFLSVERQIVIGWWHHSLMLADTAHPRAFLLVLGAAFATLSILLTHLSFRIQAQRREQKWKWAGTFWIMIICATLLCAGLVTRRLIVEVFWLTDERNWVETKQLPDNPVMAGRMLATCLRLYSSDNQGNYPLQIQDLVRLAILPPDDFHELFWREWTPGSVQQWVYVNSLNDSSAGEFPLLVSPALEEGLRIVVFNDATVKKLDAAQFRKWVGKWKVMFNDYHEDLPKFLKEL